jgi:hypothetical protein
LTSRGSNPGQEVKWFPKNDFGWPLQPYDWKSHNFFTSWNEVLNWHFFILNGFIETFLKTVEIHLGVRRWVGSCQFVWRFHQSSKWFCNLGVLVWTSIFKSNFYNLNRILMSLFIQINSRKKRNQLITQ